MGHLISTLAAFASFSFSMAHASEAGSPLLCAFTDSGDPLEAALIHDAAGSCERLSVRSLTTGTHQDFTCAETQTSTYSQQQAQQDEMMPLILRAAHINIRQVKAVTAYSVSLDDDGGAWVLLNVDLETQPLTSRQAIVRTAMGGFKGFSCQVGL